MHHGIVNDQHIFFFVIPHVRSNLYMNGIITVVCVRMNTHLASKELKTRPVIWIGSLSRDHYPEIEHLLTPRAS